MQTRNTGASTDLILQLVPSVGAGGGSNLNWECQLVIGESTHVPPECRNSGTLVYIGDAHANGVSVGGNSSASTGSSSSGSDSSGSGLGGTEASGNTEGDCPFVKKNGKPDKKKCKEAGYT